MNLNILTYNIRGKLWTDDASDQLAAIIKLQKIDILVLQEVVSFVKEGGETRRPKIVDGVIKRLSKEITFNDVSFLPIQSKNETVGNVILFNSERLQPVGSVHGKAFPKYSFRKLYEEFFGRLAPPMRKIVMSEKFRFMTLRKKRLIVYNCHLDFFGGNRDRVRHLRHFFNLWGEDRFDANVIEVIAGDFNTWAPYQVAKISHKYSRLAKFLRKSGFVNATKDIEWTHRYDRVESDKIAEKNPVVKKYDGFAERLNDRIRQKLDHVWVRGNVEVLSAVRLDADMSDHKPILVRLRVDEGYEN